MNSESPESHDRPLSMPRERVNEDVLGSSLREVILCPQCLAEALPLADFCKQCGAPLTSLATMDPLKHVFAEGWAYRRITWGRPRPFVVAGIWLLFAPTALVNLIMLIYATVSLPGAMTGRSIPTLSSRGIIPPFQGLSALLLWMLLAASLVLEIAILYKATRAGQRERRLRAGLCLFCGYDLRALPQPRCPECGNSFDPEELEDTDESGEPDETENTGPDA